MKKCVILTSNSKSKGFDYGVRSSCFNETLINPSDMPGCVANLKVDAMLGSTVNIQSLPLKREFIVKKIELDLNQDLFLHETSIAKNAHCNKYSICSPKNKRSYLYLL